MKLHAELVAVSVFGAMFGTVHGLEIRRISDPIPSDRMARRVKVTGDGNCFVYESDIEYQYNGTGNAAFGENVKHIWKTCGVFGDGMKDHQLLSSMGYAAIDDLDDDAPATSHDGMKHCYHTEDTGSSVIAMTDSRSTAITYIGRDSVSTEARRSNFCDISSDGRSVVFQSDSQLVPGVSVTRGKYQVYLTNNRGNTFTLVAGNDIAESGEYSLLSSYPKVSEKGSFVTFQGKIPYRDETTDPKTPELFLYKVKGKILKRLTDFNNNYCNLTSVYELMKEHWGEADLLEEGVTKASVTQCNLMAVLGLGGQTSGNLLGAGHGPARMSSSGRFIAYTAGFDHATIRGTKEFPQVITAANLFLYDTHLGLIWQITKEGDVGNPTALEKKIEDYSCPGASPSYQRDTCSQIRIFTGFCCWQRTSWFPAQWPDISHDGSSIAFFTTFPHNGGNETDKDYEIYHYHIRTNKFTAVTNTADGDLDDMYPSISHNGTVVAFESDFDHTTNQSIVSENQVFAAKLTYGCPHFLEADNYEASPDVPVSCMFKSDVTETSVGNEKVTIKFNGDLTEMMNNIPFPTKKRKKILCNTYITEVMNDLSFSLEIPVSLVSIEEKALKECLSNKKNSWNKKGIHMKVGFFTRDGFPTPGELKEKLLSLPSALWNGYLTKTISSIE